MKAEFEQAQAFFDLKLRERPRGFELCLRELMTNFLKAYEPENPTVYVSGYAFPTELLWAFDVTPFDFEIACNNLPAAIGGRGSSLMQPAEKEGYSTDVCSFDRLIISCHLTGELPPGRLYLTSSYYCHGKAKANEAVAEAAGRENVIFDVPHEAGPAAFDYVLAQLKGITARLEAATGQRLDLDRLREAIRSSNRARATLGQVQELMKNKPCPWDGMRACLLSLAGAVFWGSPVLERVYDLILQEIEDRVKKGSALPENHRILWFPWVPVQTINAWTIFRENRVTIPMVEAAQIWWSELDPERPFEALARKALENYMLGPVERRVKSLLRLAEEYSVDGAVHFSSPACHQENAAFRPISDAFKARGLPVLNLEADMTDERNYSPQVMAGRLSSFLEVLANKRG
ncbi:MAG: 2-hydroxyacyl-CoA dehydratase family protein [Thermodesulfobacteriota bacterium]